MRQGAHQVAQKSTTARPLCCSIWLSKSASFTSTALDIFYSPDRRIPRGSSSVSFRGDVGGYVLKVKADRRPLIIKLNDPINPAWHARIPHWDRGRGSRR